MHCECACGATRVPKRRRRGSGAKAAYVGAPPAQSGRRLTQRPARAASQASDDDLDPSDEDLIDVFAADLNDLSVACSLCNSDRTCLLMQHGGM